MKLEENKKKIRTRKKSNFDEPKIIYKDSLKSGERKVTYSFSSLRVKRKMFPSNSFA